MPTLPGLSSYRSALSSKVGMRRRMELFSQPYLLTTLMLASAALSQVYNCRDIIGNVVTDASNTLQICVTIGQDASNAKQIYYVTFDGFAGAQNYSLLDISLMRGGCYVSPFSSSIAIINANYASFPCGRIECSFCRSTTADFVVLLSNSTINLRPVLEGYTSKPVLDSTTTEITLVSLTSVLVIQLNCSDSLHEDDGVTAILGTPEGETFTSLRCGNLPFLVYVMDSTVTLKLNGNVTVVLSVRAWTNFSLTLPMDAFISVFLSTLSESTPDTFKQLSLNLDFTHAVSFTVDGECTLTNATVALEYLNEVEPLRYGEYYVRDALVNYTSWHTERLIVSYRSHNYSPPENATYWNSFAVNIMRIEDGWTDPPTLPTEELPTAESSTPGEVASTGAITVSTQIPTTTTTFVADTTRTYTTTTTTVPPESTTSLGSTTTTPPGLSALDMGLIATSCVVVVVAITTTACCACFKCRRDAAANLILAARAKPPIDTVKSAANEYMDEYEIDRGSVFVDLGFKLGKGAFGDVYRGTMMSGRTFENSVLLKLSLATTRSSPYVAVKMMHDSADVACRIEFLREIALMKSIGYHERLVNMLCCVTLSEPLLLVLEYCSEGDLLSFLRERRAKTLATVGSQSVDPWDGSQDEHVISARDRYMFATQIAAGMEYLASRGYIHRDLAARNVLVDGPPMACKVGDFGLCRRIDDEETTYQAKGGMMPYKWMPPEAARAFVFSTASDIWSFGVVLFEIFTLGEVPYAEWPSAEVIERLDRGERMAYRQEFGEQIYEMMSRCWNAEPERRPTFTSLRAELGTILEGSDSSAYYYLHLGDGAGAVSN